MLTLLSLPTPYTTCMHCDICTRECEHSHAQILHLLTRNTQVSAAAAQHGKPDSSFPGGRAVCYGDFLKHFLITLRARDSGAAAPAAASATSVNGMPPRPSSQGGRRSDQLPLERTLDRPATASGGLGASASASRCVCVQAYICM
jgi:hypothetical protein